MRANPVFGRLFSSICLLRRCSSDSEKVPTLTPTVRAGATSYRPGALTEESNREALKDARPPPQEEITSGVCQETYYSADDGHQEISDGKIDNDVVEGLSELLKLKSDEHHQEVLAQRQRSHHKHEDGQDGKVPLRDGLDGSTERIVGGGELRGHRVGPAID